MNKINKSLYVFFICSFIFLLLFIDSIGIYKQVEDILFKDNAQVVYVFESKNEVEKYENINYISEKHHIDYLKSISEEMDIKKISTILNYNTGKIRINLYNFKENDSKKIITGKDFIIKESSYKNIGNNSIYGEYLVNGNNVLNFINKITENGKFEAIIIPSYEYLIGVKNYEMNILYLTAFFILSMIMFIVLCKNKYKYRKNISVYKMYGYSNNKIILSINKKDNRILGGIILVVFIIFFIIKSFPNINDFMYFIYLIKSIIIYIVIFIFLDLLASINIVIRTNIQNMNKKENVKYTKVNKVLMSLFTAFAVALVGMFANYFFEYKNRDIGSRLGNDDYITISTDFRGELNGIKQIPFEIMEKQAFEWKLADENNGIYLKPGNKYLANSTTFEEARFLDDYVLINNNYLEKVKIYDENENRIKNIDDDKYTITVLVPERYKGNKEVLRFIKSEHLFRVSEGIMYDRIIEGESDNYKNYLKINKKASIIERNYIGKEADKLKENIIYIDDNQKFDSLSNEFPLNDEMVRETNYIISPIAFVINSENFSDMGNKSYAGNSMYFSAINNGYMKFKVDDIKNPEKEVERILYESKLVDRFSRIDTIQGMEDRATIMLRKSLITYSVLVVLMIIFSLGMIKVDLDEYIESNKKKIGIKYFLGYNRMKIFKSYFSGYVLKNIFSFAYILIIWKVFYMYIKMNFYYKMDFMPVILIYIGLVVLEFVYLVIKIRKTDISYIDLK